MNGQTAPRVIALFKRELSPDQIYDYEKKASKLSKAQILRILKDEGLLDKWPKEKKKKS
jgi:hypothetical protein